MTSKLPMWAPCSKDREWLKCPCGNDVASGGFYAVGLREHIDFNTPAPVGEINPHLWGLVECQDCGTVIDNATMMEPWADSPLQPSPYLSGRDLADEGYSCRLLIVWMSPLARTAVHDRNLAIRANDDLWRNL